MVDNAVFDSDDRSRPARAERHPDPAPSHADLHEPDVQRNSNDRSPSQNSQDAKDPDASLYPDSLFANRHLASRGNEPVRIAIMQQMQEAHGNRAVQRFMSLQRLPQASAQDNRSEDSSLGESIQSAQGQGSSLDNGTQERLETGLGADLSNVKVHTGSDADQMAKSVDAVAFTTGQDIFFREGAYNPSTQEGMRLLAHEATHTVQQSQGPVAGSLSSGGVSISDPSDSFEQAAETTANRVASTTATPAQRKLDQSAQPSGAYVQRSPHGVPVQRFGSMEHQSLGNEATGTANVNVGGEQSYDRFELHHGDVIALSGDYFLTSKDEYPPDVPYENDDLFTLAKVPSMGGIGVGTRDEIIYALYEINKHDARFQKGGIWETHAGMFSMSDHNPADAHAGHVVGQAWKLPFAPDLTENVKKAVKARYNKLAAANITHFAAPTGRDDQGNPLPSPKGSAGGSYRNLHERAIEAAHEAGSKKGDISHAMAMEAAAQHYLTDAFSAGHVRTERGNIKQYWHEKYPLFWYNLFHKIILDTAIKVNDISTNLTTIGGTVYDIYNGVKETAEPMLAGLPEITFGELVSLVFHDYDNEVGVMIQGGNKVYGDSHLDEPDPANETRERAQAAIQAGNHDIKIAFELGKSGFMPMFERGLFDDVQARTNTTDGQYEAETMIPKPDADNPRQNWKADSIEELWDKPVVDGAPITVGDMIIESLQPGHDMGDKVTGLATEFPEVQERDTGNVKPRQGYIEGFLNPLLADPKKGILSIINWAPNYGMLSSGQDQVAIETGEELDKQGRLKGMTTEARVGYIDAVLGIAMSESDMALIERIFATAPPRERPEIYKKVEGHEWEGDWHEGWFKADDDLYNGLDDDKLDRVKDLINEGVTSK